MLGFSLNPIDWVTDAAGAVIGGASNAILDAVVSWVQDALAYVTRQVATVLTGLSEPDFGSSAFDFLGGTFRWLALVSVAATIMLAAAGSLVNPKVELSHVIREIPVTMVMLAGWYAVAALWFEGCRALTTLFLGDALMQAIEAGLSLDAGIASFFRLLICVLMIIALLVFLIEMFVLYHLMTFAAILGPVAIALRPWPPLKDVSARMIRNVASLSLTPALTAASMSLAMRNVNEAGVLGIGQAVGGFAGMIVSVLMPVLVSKFLPFGGSGDSGGRALIAAAAAMTATVAVIGASGGAAGAAAPAVGADRLAALHNRGSGPGGDES